MNFFKITKFSFIILVVTSVFCITLLMFQHYSIATMLGWFGYLPIAFRCGSFIFSQIFSSTLYCWMSRSWTIFEKKAFGTFAVLFSVLMISSFSVRAILSLDLIFLITLVYQFSKISSHPRYFSHLTDYNTHFSFSLEQKHSGSVVSRYLSCFHYSYIWGICF